jgi:hypothetical protein
MNELFLDVSLETQTFLRNYARRNFSFLPLSIFLVSLHMKNKSKILLHFHHSFVIVTLYSIICEGVNIATVVLL